MSKVREHNPIVIEEINGLWSRGDDESCPLDHLLLANNIQFLHSGIETRQAAYTFIIGDTTNDLSKIRRVYNYTTQQDQTLLVLVEGGKIYHVVSVSEIYLILTIVGMEDFAFISIAGRAYISPIKIYPTESGVAGGISWNHALGMKNEFVYVYYRPPGTTVGTTIKARTAAGLPPSNVNSGGFTRWNEPFLAYTSEFAGGTTQGHHAFGVNFFSTAIGPVIVPGVASPLIAAVGHAPGDKSIQLTGIPIGNVGTTYRKVYMTKSNTYVPGTDVGFFYAFTINDNFTTSFRVDLADVNLTVPYASEGADARPFKSALTVENFIPPVTIPPTPAFCDLGFHLIGVVFETDTGYLTSVGPEFYGGQTYIDENYAVRVSNIPVGPVENAGPPIIPSRVIKRHLVSTKAIPEYNGDQKGYQFFFIPNSTLENNTDTVKIVSYYDSDLIADASHLIDNFTKIPSGVSFCEYHSRLVLVGDSSFPKDSAGNPDTKKPDNRSIAYLSAPGEPEAISQIDGLIITPLDGNPLTNCEDFRDVLYLFKQNRTYSVVDNQDDPVTWGPVEVVDQGIGTSIHGIANVLDSGGVNVDYLIIVDHSGLMLFNGTYARPELSWKIENVWMHLDKNKFHKIQIVNDSIRKKIWFTHPGDLNLLFLVDYGNGLNPKDIRWAIWHFEKLIITSIVLYKIDKLILGTFSGLVPPLDLFMLHSKQWPPNDLDYPKGITIPPYPFVIPGNPIVLPEMGGGLIILDPTNNIKHDVFWDASRQPVIVTIKTAIRTAFLGG